MRKLIFLTELIFASTVVFGMVNEPQESTNISSQKLTKKEATDQLWSELKKEEKDIKKIKELIDLGADFNNLWSWDNGINGKTPFIWVIEEGCPEIVEYMIQHGADVNAPAQYGDRDLPIMLATIGRGDINLVRLFLNYGADTTITNNKGKTLIMYAAEYRNVEILKMLLGENDCDLIVSQIFNKNSLCNELKNNFLVNATDLNGRTALMFALQNRCPRDNTETVKFLIEKGAKVNAEDKHGNTPLIIALQSNPKYKMIEYLIEMGANVNAKNKFGSTPLSAAKMRLNDWKPWENQEQIALRKKETENIIRLLKKNGAK